MSGMKVTIRATILSIAFATLSAARCYAAQSFVSEEPAVGQALLALQQHQLVALGEPHRSVPFHRFLQALVRDPRFPQYVSTIVVEFGNARYQSIIDAYVAGAPIPDDRLVLVWRNTTQLLVWDAPMYRAFFQSVRRVNAGLPETRKIRVLLGDPPINWDKTKAAADFPASYGYRDWYYADVVENSVLRSGGKALLIMGGVHLTHHDMHAGAKPVPRERDSVGSILSREYPGSLYSIWPYFGAPQPAQVPSLVATDLSPLAKASFGRLVPDVLFIKRVAGKLVPYQPNKTDFPPIDRMTDAVLFLGKVDVIEPAPPSSYSAAYLHELRRRALILQQVFGYPFVDQVKAL